MKYQVTFIYAGGRKNKIEFQEATDFFYGYVELKKQGVETKFIELSESRTNFFDRVCIKLFRLPLYFFKAVSYKNLKILRDSKNLIFINESSYLSFLPLLIFSKKANVLFFPMGLMNKYNNGRKISKYLIKFSLRFSDQIIFIGKGELTEANRIFAKNYSKFSHLPFSVDKNFWEYKQKTKSQLNNILFVGNDSNRDFELLNEIVAHFKNFNFTIITKNKTLNLNNYTNVNVIEGSWREPELNDSELLEYYHKNDLVILPIKDSSQPSGQSVALQAMSSGLPVMITKTSGFWDENLFENNKNIYFVNGFDLNSWIEAITEAEENTDLKNIVAKNAYEIISNKLNLDIFIYELKNYLVDIDL